jgi:adenine-specific DNA methylase
MTMPESATDGTHPLIDEWFPVNAVDAAVKTTAGSGLSEKALFTWFASRPIAQARAAVMTALLPDDAETRADVELAIRNGDRRALDRVAAAVRERFGPNRPVVVDVFSGRGMIPLEAARIGAVAVGIDLSQVATLAGRLLADYPIRDWSSEPTLPFAPSTTADGVQSEAFAKENRLVADVRAAHAEVGRRVADRVGPFYPKNDSGEFPWGYLWSITMPCDSCRRRFPLVGSLVLRHPHDRNSDPGQSLHFVTSDRAWAVRILDGPPVMQPTYTSSDRGDGKKKKGKSARCLFCQHVHSLETVKAKGIAHQYEDELLVVADTRSDGRRVFRLPTVADTEALERVNLGEVEINGCPYLAVPDERIPAGNVHTLMASGYGYERFGELACSRQTLSFVETANVIRDLHREMIEAAVSPGYAGAIASYLASTLCRRIRCGTRGCRLRTEGDSTGKNRNTVRVGDLFVNECNINFQFDYFEAGPGEGAGTWSSVSTTGVRALEKIISEARGAPARLRHASATALPFRDGTVDAVVTDPPYYDMVEYADGSDLFHVWLKRILFDIEPDLFGPDTQQRDGLQNKDDEIIVRRVHEPGRVRHDKPFYEGMLAQAFTECKRVLRPDGHLVVVFGHSDPDAWRRLLGALHDAGFVVAAAWPARTESANTGVASIKVTVTIGCRVAPEGRRGATAAQVEREITNLIRSRVKQWDEWGLALSDQLMASYGPAMEVVGQYRSIERPDSTVPDLDHFLAVGRREVSEAHAFKVDELPLDTFDAQTRFAIFWLRAFARTTVNKGEAVFHAQSSELRIDDLRPSVLIEVNRGFALTLDEPPPVTERSPVIHVARAIAAAWPRGGTEAAAQVIAEAGLSPDDSHLWATVGELVRQLPQSDKVAMALIACQRNRRPIEIAARQTAHTGEQLTLESEASG